VENCVTNLCVVLRKLSIDFLQLSEAGDFERDMLHADLLRVRHQRAGLAFPERQHVMVVINIRAEEQHAAIVLADLGKTQDFGEKFARAFENP
jgi:hypothetical protein